MTAGSIWQQVEFGSYAADLPVWLDLADSIGDPILELGAGAGRVSVHLAGRGHEVIALERDGELAAELERSAERMQAPVTVLTADLNAPRRISLPQPPALVVGPLHLIQVLDTEARRRLLTWLLGAIAPGATLALTVVDEENLLSAGASASQILPDMREVDGWVYSSEPLWVLVGDDTLSVRRVREEVSPDGAIDRNVHDELLYRLSPARLEAEATVAGFEVVGRRIVNSGPREADSIVVLLEKPR
jgi:precorrin-6B methylase 2